MAHTATIYDLLYGWDDAGVYITYQCVVCPNYDGLGGGYANNYGGLDSIIIQDTIIRGGTTYKVTTIGTYAFMNCDASFISLPNTITTVGWEGLDGCYGLKSIPNSITTIEGAAFSNTGLTKVNLTNVTVISDMVFSRCGELTDVTLPNVTLIGNDAFSECPRLNNISIPNVTSIGKWAFKGCTGLTNIAIPNGVTTISEATFEGCEGLIDITIPNSVTTIDSAAFMDCRGLTKVHLSDSITAIGAEAFRRCTGLTKITIPNSVTAIGNRAFEDCTGLTDVTVETATPIEGFIYALPSQTTATAITIHVPCGSASEYSQLEYYGGTAGSSGHFIFVEPDGSYSITTSSNDKIRGEVLTVQANTCNNDTTILFAQSTIGYHFTQWNDGNTDNPRVVVLTQDTALTAEFAQSYSGQCGDSLYWSFDENVLTIYGSGDMYDYDADNVPWLLFRNATTRILMERGITHIGNNAFSGFTKVEKVEFPNTLLSIGENAFANCRKLYDVYSYAIEPPFAGQSSFSNYNVYVHIPCDNLRAYQLDAVFGTFKYVKCINADSAEADDVSVIPSSTEAEFVWPSNESADTYTLDIYKDGEVFCTLVFNANGQLNSIAFAPSRIGKVHQAATKVGSGFRFTVTGLAKDTHYQFNMDVEDEQKNTLQTYIGEFDTNSTALDEVLADEKVQKMMVDGQIYILKNNKIYTLMGVEIK